MNKVFLFGNLGADPELRMTSGGTAVLNLRIATSERFKDRNDKWTDRAEWHTIVVWGKRGEALSKLLSKGSKVLIEGKLRTSSWEDRDGNKRYKTEIHADDVRLAGASSGGGRDRDSGPSEEDTMGPRPPFGGLALNVDVDDDIPF